MKNWLIKLLGGYVENPKAPNCLGGEYQTGFSDGHIVGFKAGEIAEGRKQMNAIAATNYQSFLTAMPAPPANKKSKNKLSKHKTKKKKK